MNSVTIEKPKKTEDFVRYEFKYLLDAKFREVVEREVSHFMDLDGHSHENLHHAYYVRSLYFENKETSRFYEKIDGVRSRTKFRIRTYGTTYTLGLPIYLEEKNRNGDYVDKHRIPIDPEHLSLFCDPEKHWHLYDLYTGVDLVLKFLFGVLRREEKPMVLVDYIRRPYVSSYDMNFRVTFDSKLMATPNKSLFPTNETIWRQSTAGYTILEVKFGRRIPAWFHRIIQAHDMRRFSFSKFVRGLKISGLAMDLS